jgi:DNA polymerase-1
LIREACGAFNVPSIEVVGFEADDLIATYAHHGVQKGYEVCIISSDKDLMQLITPHVSMLDPLKNHPIREAEVLQKFGVTPDKVVEVQALAGDASDNVPGVPGVGIKTAAELINTYGNLENLLARVGEIKQPKRRQALIDYAQDARISRQLVQLRADVPLPMPIADMTVRPLDRIALNAFLRIQGFNSLLARMDRAKALTQNQELPGFSMPASVPLSEKYPALITEEALQSWVTQAMSSSVVAIVITGCR